MKLKLDKDGNVVVVDGKPVYVKDDGEEIEVDVPVLFDKVAELNGESKAKRSENKELKKTLKIFSGIEDLEKFKTDADANAVTVANYSEKDLVEAGKVDEIKAQMKTAHDEEVKRVKDSAAEQLVAKDVLIAENKDTIFGLMVSSKFAHSPLFSGADAKTVLPADVGEAYFSKHFKVEEDSNGKLRVVGYAGEGLDKEIYSSKMPGELAGFDEALEKILDQHPGKAQILKATPGGGPGGGGGGNNDQHATDDLTKLAEQHKTATASNDMTAAIAIKNRMHAIQLAAQQKQT